MSKTPGESRIPMLFASRRPQQCASLRGSAASSPTASSASSLKGSAPGTPTTTRRLASPRRGATPDPPGCPAAATPNEHAGSRSAMPALRPGLGPGRLNRLTKSASATSTRTMAAEPVSRPSRPTRPTSFPKPVVSEPTPTPTPRPRPVIDSTTRESSPVSERPTGDAGDAGQPVGHAVPAFDWNPDGIGAHHIGCRVQIAGERTGTLRYFGPIALAPGDFCGVELDGPDGKHDGTVRGVCYFRCLPLHGLLAPLHLVRLHERPPDHLLEHMEQAALDGVDSGPHSILQLDHHRGVLEADEAPQHRFDLGKDGLSSAASTPTSATGEDRSPGAFGGHAAQQQQPPHFLHLMDKQHSFDLDESLGILTPDQMADGFTVCDGSSPEEEAVAAAVPADNEEAMDVDDEHMDVDVHQVVEMVDSALRCTVGFGDGAMLDHGLDDAPQDDAAANAAVAQDAMAVDYLASRRDGGASTSDYISEDLTSKRLDRTPSVEELPLDHQQQEQQPVGGPGGATPGVATPSRSARGGKTPNSIITSVTSIASLDTGYQGDGEWSRPGSRGGEGPDDRHSPTGPPHQGIKIKGTAVDPMTDSDFFTESDADMQEERLGVAGRGGDRHAQVIDGTLYGAAGPGAHRAPPSHGEDMDSSGIYSDLERTQGGTSLAPSMPASMHGSATSATMQLKEGRTLASLNQELLETLKSMLPSAEAAEAATEEHAAGADDLGSMTSLVTVKSLQQQQQQGAPAPAPPAKPAKAVREIKKYKMPNRNVTSKVKAMMVVAQHDQENTAPKRPTRTTPKKWEAVMQKIASNAEEQSSKLARLKDVKGKVLSSMGVSTTPAVRGSRSNSLTVANVAMTRKASSSPRGGDLRKAKSRRHRLEAPSPSSATPVMSPDQRSAASTPRSSISDVSSINNLSTRSNKKNRSSSPLSDASTNSTRTKSATLPAPRATAHGGSRERSARDKASDATSADVLKKNQRNKTSVTPVLPRADKAWSGGGVGNGRAVPDKAVVVKSQTPSPRKTTAQRRATPLKDHNGRLEPVAKQQTQNGVAAVPLPARRTLGLRPSPGGREAQGPSALEVAAEARRRLLPDLRHNAAAFEAMAVLLDYTTSKLGAFAAPALRRDLAKMKSDMANTVLQLEEAQAQYRRLEEERAQQEEKAAAAEAAAKAREEERERAMAELQQRLAGHDEEVQTLTARHSGELAALRGQLDSRAVEAADAVAVATRGLREEYELELDRVTRRHEETLRAALGAARVEAERDAAHLGEAAARREAELAAQLRAKEAAHDALREQSRRVMDSMKSDRDTRTQALAARCRELQDEVDSLRSVLELRCDELQKSRRENDALRVAADQLPGAEQRISTLTARLEDLQVQLDRKGEVESKLQMENSELHQSFCKETKEKQMLSLQNEQLQFKLKQNTEVVNALAANMSDFHDVSAILNASLVNGMTPPDRSRRTCKGVNNNNNSKSAPSPPESPKVKGVVEKSESVSYMLEMEADSTDDVVARIYRRMASTPVSSPAHHAAHPAAHPRSAPPSARRTPHPLSQSASATTIPTPPRPSPKQRASSAAAARTRSRSISSDSGECLSSGNWSPPASLPPPQHRAQPRTPEPAVVVDEHLLVATGYDCSDIEDFSSSKSSSMSCSSEGSELGVAKGVVEVAEDESETEAAPFQHPQDLDLMTASCGSNSELLLAKQATLPKDAGGEEMAMDDAAHANGIHSSSEDGSGSGSASDEDDVGSGAGRGRRALAGLPRLSLPMTPTMTAGCGQSAINTPMDSSWSEDMELPVSLSET